MTTCKICNATITDPLHKRTYYDPDYPTIDIGPYCPNCMGKIRICSGCHVPGVIDVDNKYFQNGNFFCRSCQGELKTCFGCRGNTKEFAKVKGRSYCESCFKKRFVKCSCCEEIKPKDEDAGTDLNRAEYPGMFKKWKGSLCQGCFDGNKSRFKRKPTCKCEKCQTLFTNKGTGERYCDSCKASMTPCRVCNKYDHTGRNMTVDTSISGEKGKNTAFLCSTCKKRVASCESCNTYTLAPIIFKGRFSKKHVCSVCSDRNKGMGECSACLAIAMLNDDGQCSKCEQIYGSTNTCSRCGTIRDSSATCRVCGDTQIYCYSTKPHLQYWYNPKDIGDPNVIFMGIENEQVYPSNSRRDKTLKEIYTKYGPDILIAKSDASIDGAGFEIVTQPMTLESLHVMDLTGFFSEHMNFSRSCGMHVHCGRNAFTSDLHLMKVCQFINSNEDFCDKVAGRKPNNYNSKLDKKAARYVKDAKQGGTSRSNRINLTNSKTVEFRLFAGCVDEFTFRYRFEFIHALVTWAKTQPIIKHDYAFLIQFVNQNQKTYPNLNKFFCSAYSSVSITA